MTTTAIYEQWVPLLGDDSIGRNAARALAAACISPHVAVSLDAAGARAELHAVPQLGRARFARLAAYLEAARPDTTGA